MVSLYPVEEIVATVGGDDVSMVRLVEPGRDPHEVQLSARQMERVGSADVVFYLGEGFQPSVEQAVATVADRVAKVDLLDALSPITTDEGVDPHVWLDPANMVVMTRTVVAELSRLLPARAAVFESRGDTYITGLESLGVEIDASFVRCRSRTVVTAHEAFAYLSRRAGLDEVAIAGLNPARQPSAKELEDIAAVARATGATTVFFETLLDQSLARTVAAAIGATPARLDPVETISEDDRARGATYLTVQRANIAALVEGLGCS